MNKYLIGSVIFVAGFAVGSVVTYYTEKDKFQKDADKQIEEMRKYVDDKLRPYKIVEEMNKKAEEAEEKTATDIIAENVPEYTNYVQFSDSEDIERDILAKKAAQEHPTDDSDKPYIITEDQFTDPIPYYDKITLNYYPVQNELVDEMASSSEDLNVVGRENLDILAESGEEIMYVRNDKISVDYEVVLVREE